MSRWGAVLHQVPLQQQQARIAEIVLSNGSHGLVKPQARVLVRPGTAVSVHVCPARLSTSAALSTACERPLTALKSASGEGWGVHLLRPRLRRLC